MDTIYGESEERAACPIQPDQGWAGPWQCLRGAGTRARDTKLQDVIG